MLPGGLYEPETPSGSYCAIQGVESATPVTGGEAHFLYVLYKPPFGDEGLGSLGLATFDRKIEPFMVKNWVEDVHDFANNPMGVIHINSPRLALLGREAMELFMFVRSHVGREGDRPWGISSNIITVDPEAKRNFAVGPDDRERQYLHVPHRAIALAAVNAIVQQKLLAGN